MTASGWSIRLSTTPNVKRRTSVSCYSIWLKQWRNKTSVHRSWSKSCWHCTKSSVGIGWLRWSSLKKRKLAGSPSCKLLSITAPPIWPKPRITHKRKSTNNSSKCYLKNLLCFPKGCSTNKFSAPPLLSTLRRSLRSCSPKSSPSSAWPSVSAKTPRESRCSNSWR